jgi:hypothetical protein
VAALVRATLELADRPIVVIPRVDDEPTALSAIRAAAQDFVVLGQEFAGVHHEANWEDAFAAGVRDLLNVDEPWRPIAIRRRLLRQFDDAPTPSKGRVNARARPEHNPTPRTHQEPEGSL